MRLSWLVLMGRDRRQSHCAGQRKIGHLSVERIFGGAKGGRKSEYGGTMELTAVTRVQNIKAAGSRSFGGVGAVTYLSA